jgi:DNA-binding beta-propeller fold protein YncE
MRIRAYTANGLGRRWVLGALAAAAVALASEVPAQGATFVYVASPCSGEVIQYGLDSGGALSPLNPPAVAAGNYPISAAVSPNGRWVYVTNLDGVAQFDLGRGGLLVPNTPPTVAASGSVGVAVSLDRSSVYVAQLFGTVSQYDVGVDGALSPKDPATITLGSPPAFPWRGRRLARTGGRSTWRTSAPRPRAPTSSTSST